AQGSVEFRSIDLSAVQATETPTRQTPRQRHLTDRAKSERRLAYMLVAPAVIVMVLVTIYPMINAFVLSLQRADLRFPQNNQFIGFDNYGSVLSSPLWWQDVLHTMIITVFSVGIELVIG